MISVFYLLRFCRLSRNNALQVLSRALSLFAGVLLLNFSFVQLLAQGTSSKPSSIVKLAKVVVIGHADETASVDANRAEGWQRADFVVKELVRRGVPESLITATSQGNSQLLQRRTKESAFTFRARCRRVELMKIWR